MTAQVQRFWAVKAGSAPEDYEDAWDDDPPAGRFAVADGATESSFARLWAQLLVKRVVRDNVVIPRKGDLGRWLAEPASAWQAQTSSTRLPWYAQAKVQAGAFAALVGLTAVSGRRGGGRWHAIAVGDSCLFHLRRAEGGVRLLRAFPLNRSAHFGRSPTLLSTRPDRTDAVKRCFRASGGWFRAGDVFLLTTDALAQTLLLAEEQEAPCWEELLAIQDPDAFAAWIADRRSRRQLRNDDVTALVVRW